MATAAQILANRLNAQRSSGPVSPAGKQASSQNRTTHGLCKNDNTCSYLLPSEDTEKFLALRAALKEEHQPQTETERILVRRLADHEWQRTRAMRLQTSCLGEDQEILPAAQLALYMRYQTNHERAFYKALNELQKLRALREKSQIGFESQKRQQAAEQRAAEVHNLKKQAFRLKEQAFELKKERLASPKPPEKSKNQPCEAAASQNKPVPTPGDSPGDLEMAA